jgi:hypothetical protein
VGMAAQNAMIRVREMNVRPDATQTKLAGSITFVGNYARPQAAAAPATSSSRRRAEAAAESKNR